MKNTVSILLLAFLTVLGLQACVKNQDTSTNGATTATPPPDQSLNNTNYQQVMQEQSLRAQEEVANHPHVGGRR